MVTPETSDATQDGNTISGPLTLTIEHLTGPARENLGDSASLASERMMRIIQIGADCRPDEAPVHFVFTGDFIQSVKTRLGEGSSYDTQRGANSTIARTMRRDDEGYDIIYDAAFLFSLAQDPPEDIAALDAVLDHVAAHEPQHVAMAWTRTDAEHFQDLVTLEPVPRRFRKSMAIVIEEYRCERAANKIAPSASTRASAFHADIAHFRDSLNASLAICNSDISTALFIAMTAVSELWKAMGYLAAEVATVDDGQPPTEPDSSIQGWEPYVGEIWPVVRQILALAPPANEPTTAQHLATVTELLCKAVSYWMPTIGILYDYDEQLDESCYWTRPSF